MLTIRFPETLYSDALRDLRRPHHHAAERIGFLFAQLVPTTHGGIILMRAYKPVLDEHYVRDPSVGARVHGDAIRMAMQHALDTGDGLFHTHLHEWPGRPEFSPVDRRELSPFIPAFQTVSRGRATGLFLFSPDAAIADVWLPGKTLPMRATTITVVGFPFRFLQ